MSDFQKERYAQTYTPQMMSHVDPYLFQTLQHCLNREIVVQTTKDSVRGILKSLSPDHLVMDVKGYHFHVRIQHVVWVKHD